MSTKSFDLNIEQILENWEVRHGLREIIANALDEQALSGSAPPSITRRGEAWIVRDFGRGIRHTHLTQNENQEKLESQVVIGKFGIGLKDALATFERHGVTAHVKSRYGVIHTEMASKHGFGDVFTLHAIIDDPEDSSFVGTEFELLGVPDAEMEAALALFLRYSGQMVLDTTRYGQIIQRSETATHGSIYISGVKVAEEPNFLFSYNITLLTAPIRKAINRERSHVGRTAYTDSVKKILLASNHAEVARRLAEDIAHFHTGSMHDELAWVDVQEHAVRLLNSQSKVLLVTAEEAMRFPDMIDQARSSGHSIITIPETLKQKIGGGVDIAGNPMVDLAQFTQNYNDSFRFEFVEPAMLSGPEREVHSQMGLVIAFFGGLPPQVKDIRISNTMRPDLMGGGSTVGCWDPATQSIVLSRHLLSSFASMSSTLLHELVHAASGYSDVTRDFETALTELLGKLSEGWRLAKQSIKEVQPPQGSLSDRDKNQQLIRELDAAKVELNELRSMTRERHDDKAQAFNAPVKPWYRFW